MLFPSGCADRSSQQSRECQNKLTRGHGAGQGSRQLDRRDEAVAPHRGDDEAVRALGRQLQQERGEVFGAWDGRDDVQSRLLHRSAVRMRL